jgi:hypothetical protein
MEFAPVLRLTLAHDYYGNAAPPIGVQPSDPLTFDRAGLLLRHTGQHVTIIADKDQPRPTSVRLNLVADSPYIFAVTEGAGWKAIPQMRLPLGADRVGFADLVPEKTETQSQSRYLARLVIDLPADPGSDVRNVTLEFGAVATLWAYYLTGARADTALQVVDLDGEMGFQDLGKHSLPNGKTAQVLRSDRPIPARARPTRQFALQQPGPFGPKTIMPVLPAAGVQFKTVTESDAAARLQSDIFVTLW